MYTETFCKKTVIYKHSCTSKKIFLLSIRSIIVIRTFFFLSLSKIQTLLFFHFLFSCVRNLPVITVIMQTTTFVTHT